jgi:hypothetical protein
MNFLNSIRTYFNNYYYSSRISNLGLGKQFLSEIHTAYFILLSLFWKNKLGLWGYLSLYLCVSVCIPLINFRMPEPVFYKSCYKCHGIWDELNGILQKSLLSICVFVLVSRHIVTRQRFGKHVSATMNAHNNRRSVRRVFFNGFSALLLKQFHDFFILYRVGGTCWG